MVRKGISSLFDNWHVVVTQADRGIAENDVIAGVIPRHPLISQDLRVHHQPALSLIQRFREAAREIGPTHIELIRRQTQAIAPHDSRDHIAEPLDLRIAPVPERVGPRAIDMRKYGKRASVAM